MRPRLEEGAVRHSLDENFDEHSEVVRILNVDYS